MKTLRFFLICSFFLWAGTHACEGAAEESSPGPAPEEVTVDQKIQQLQTILSKSPYARGYYELGKLYESADRLLPAEQQFKKVILMEPGNAKAYQALGTLYGRMERKQESIDVLKMAYEINPGEDEVIDALAVSYQLAGKQNEAIDLYEKAVKEKPDDMMRLARLGQAFAFKGKEKKAITIYEQVLEKRPDIEPVRYELIKLYNNRKDLKKVSEHLQILKQNSPAEVQ